MSLLSLRTLASALPSVSRSVGRASLLSRLPHLSNSFSSTSASHSSLLSLSARPTLPSPTSQLSGVRTFKMPAGAKRTKSVLSRSGKKTARKAGKRKVSPKCRSARQRTRNHAHYIMTCSPCAGQAAQQAYEPDQLGSHPPDRRLVRRVCDTSAPSPAPFPFPCSAGRLARKHLALIPPVMIRHCPGRGRAATRTERRV